MKENRKSIGLIAIGVILITISIFMYISNGKNTLKKYNDDSIFVEDETFEEVSAEKEKSKSNTSNDNTLKESEEREIIELKDERIVVDIKGEINNPGVYYLKDGSIVEDLIREAGGTTKKASLNSVNRAERLTNNACIIIPNIDNKEEIATSSNLNTDINTKSSAGNVDNNKGNKININKANEDELQNINGIGPSKAKGIITYREEKGPFKSIEDIKNVNGIGEGTFEKIKDSITL